MKTAEQGVVQTATTPAGDSLGQTPGRLMALDIYRGLAVAGMITVDNPGSDDKAYWAI